MPDSDSCIREIRRLGKDMVVALAGAVDMHSTPMVHKVLVSACEEKPQRLVIDLGAVSYMDSSGIGTLVEVFRRVNAYKGKLALCGLNERVRSVFEITKLDKFFQIYATQSEALAE